ncbi:MAG: thermonuclease family protein [Methanobacteriota archaeon]
MTRVIDGDTLDVDLCGRVRLALVDAPERDEPGFVEARDFAASLCPVGGGATVDRDAGQPEDTTGTRLVAVVYCGGRNLNADLLAAGYAVILVEFCRISEFADDAWAAPHCDGA